MLSGKQRQCAECEEIYHFSVKHECAPVKEKPIKSREIVKKTKKK